MAASTGTAPAPQLVVRALAGGAVPVVSRLPQYEELVLDGELGLLFEPRDTVTLTAQLARLHLGSAAGRVVRPADPPRRTRSSSGRA